MRSHVFWGRLVVFLVPISIILEEGNRVLRLILSFYLFNCTSYFSSSSFFFFFLGGILLDEAKTVSRSGRESDQWAHWLGSTFCPESLRPHSFRSNRKAEGGLRRKIQLYCCWANVNNGTLRHFAVGKWTGTVWCGNLQKRCSYCMIGLVARPALSYEFPSCLSNSVEHVQKF